MDISQLETFLAVAEERGFSRAAVRLRRTQSAVSQAVRKLEGELGERLFERTARDGSLTSAGEVLRQYAERLLRLRAEAASAVKELRTLERGRLVLAANEYTCLYLLPVLDQFRRHHPQVGIAVHRALASRIPEDLLQRNAEIGIVSFSPGEEQLRAIGVYVDDLAFVVNPNHPFVKQRRVPIRELGAQAFIAHNVASPLRQRVTETFQKHKTPLNIAVELPSLEAVKRFVAMGNGVALVPGLTVQQEVARGDLVRVEVPELKIERRLRVVFRRHAPLSPAGRALLKLVRAMAREQGAPFEYRVEHGA